MSGADDVRNQWDEDLPENEPPVQAERLALGDEQRLPWLESADDVDLDEPMDSGAGRLIAFAVGALVLLVAIIGGVWWVSHRVASPAAQADGSLIEASKEPYKVAPKDPGGKTFAGTGDASFTVSDGGKPPAVIAGSNPAPSAPAQAAPSASASPSDAASPAASGVGVQIGAFSSNASAEAAWSKLSSVHEPLKGLSHRVVEGRADIGTVYRLQALAGDAAAANALCSALQAGGLKCQVKR
ncbi:SPOR domain-containing protein [Novosphingobium sp.]|uniref:SPOR domain-containing protein n=1 Tax=Novosphingobium sp. TaxID=1874826 RepID=UPI0038BCFF4F